MTIAIPDRPIPTGGTSDPGQHQQVWDLSAREVVGALNDLGIGPGWAVADQLRTFAAQNPSAQGLGPAFAARQPRVNEAFRNLVVGMIAERLFDEICLTPLEIDGFTVRDFRAVHDNRDYVVEKDGMRLPINVKVSATRFEGAQRLVGLDPDDCLAFSAYKAWSGASKRVLFVSLVDHDLRKKVDEFMEGLDGHTRTVWELFSHYGGPDWDRGAKKAQDQFITDLFRRHHRALLSLAGDTPNFRAISAQRVVAIMNENWNRNPGLTKPGMSGGSQIHVSMARETCTWAGIVQMLQAEGVSGVLRAMGMRTVSTPQGPGL